MTKHPLQHWLLLGLLSVCISCAFILTKVALHSLAPPTVVFARLALASLILVPFAWRERRGFARIRLRPFHILGIALTWMAAPFLFSTWGQQKVPSATSGVLMAIIPLVTVLLAHFLLPDEKLTRAKIVGFAVGFCGILILIGPEALHALAGDPTILIRKLALLTAALAFSGSTILMRLTPRIPLMLMACVTIGVAALMAAPFAAPHLAADFARVTPESAGAIVALALVPTIVGFLLSLRLVREAGAGFAAYLNYLVPLGATFFGTMIGGETLDANVFIALPVILGGIAISQLGGRSRAVIPAAIP